MSGTLTAPEARALIEARLGRPPEDAYEAAVVLEAWGGERAGTVFRLSSETVRDGTGADRSEGARVADATEERTVADAIATLLTVLCIAAWSTPLAVALGPDERIAFGLALPLALAVQWAIQARYRIVGKRRLVGLRRDLPTVVAVSVGGTLTASLTLGRAGLVAALLVLIWAGGSLVARSGLAWVQAGTVAAVAVALQPRRPRGGRARSGGGRHGRNRGARAPARGSALAAWSGSARPRGSGERSPARPAAHR